MYVAVHAVRSGWFSMLGQNHVSCDCVAELNASAACLYALLCTSTASHTMIVHHESFEVSKSAPAQYALLRHSTAAACR